MTEREKVLNDLRELCEYLFHEYKVCYKGDEEDTYNRFIAANNALNLLKSQPEQKFFVDSDGKITPLPIQPQWISVEDRMPPDDQMVIGYTPVDGYMFIGFHKTHKYSLKDASYSYSYWYIITSMRSTKHMHKKVTHWMPLPEPPKEEKQ